MPHVLIRESNTLLSMDVCDSSPWIPVDTQTGYLLPTLTWKITCWQFDWTLQSSSGRNVSRLFSLMQKPLKGFNICRIPLPSSYSTLMQLKCTRLSSSIAQLIQELHLGEAMAVLDGVISGFVSVVWAQGSLMARKSRMPLGFQTDMCGWIFVVCCSCMGTALSCNISFSK